MINETVEERFNNVILRNEEDLKNSFDKSILHLYNKDDGADFFNVKFQPILKECIKMIKRKNTKSLSDNAYKAMFLSMFRRYYITINNIDDEWFEHRSFYNKK